jgi:hypothetical protein
MTGVPLRFTPAGDLTVMLVIADNLYADKRSSPIKVLSHKKKYFYGEPRLTPARVRPVALIFGKRGT